MEGRGEASIPGDSCVYCGPRTATHIGGNLRLEIRVRKATHGPARQARPPFFAQQIRPGRATEWDSCPDGEDADRHPTLSGGLC